MYLVSNFDCREHYFDNDYDAHDEDDRDIDEEEDRIKEDRSSPSGSVTYPLKLFDFFIKFQISPSWEAEESLQRQSLFFLFFFAFVKTYCSNAFFTTSLEKRGHDVLFHK